MDSNQSIQSKQQEQCPNCSYSPLSPEMKFCLSCGQAFKEKRVTVWSLVLDAFSNFFNLDNKLWQTLLNLFIPGKLTKEFFVGRHQRYVSPLRIFLITALAFFAVIQVFKNEDMGISIDLGFSNKNEDAFYAIFLEKLAKESDTLLVDFSDFPMIPLVLDSLKQRMRRTHSDSVAIGVIDIFSRDEEMSNLMIAQKDLVELSQDSLVKRYGNGHFLDDLILQQNIRLAGKGENFLSYLMEQLVWMMLLIMPFLALFLKLLYIRNRIYYVDHLIFSFHVHAFIFLLFSILLLLNAFLPHLASNNTINAIGSIGGLIYLYVALLKVYGQSKIKTFIKLILMNIFYTLLFVVAIIFTAIISALSY